ncbi:MAG: nuclear transport factor 2 family protein [Vicinamibacterales bacterium]|nr:nuclear transport factor 2 family protein [Vicinamibacterales bacterium]
MRKSIAHSFLLAGFLSLAAVAAQAKYPTTETVDSWLARYGAAWEARDPSAAGALFTVTAKYAETPFDPPKQGRAAIEEYWRTVTADQRDIKFDWKVFAVNGYVGVAHWSAKFRLESTGAVIELDGMFVLEFSPENPDQCSALAEWWHVRSSK